ncbi:hypothetical protein ACS3QZ_02685 [Shimia sp. W99]
MTDWKELLPRPCYQRPFVCDGFPQDQDVIVIGENPATVMDADWWGYWDETSGFDRARFMADYARKRSISGTRARLERMRTVHGLKVLEANVASNEKIDGAGSGAIDNSALLRVLLDSRPTIIHGRKAATALDRLGLRPDHAIEVGHFSRMSYRTLDELCHPYRR